MATQVDFVREGEQLVRKIKQFLNTDLKAILKEEGLAVSGVKAALQERLKEHVQNIVNMEDPARFKQISDLINYYGGRQQNAQSTPSHSTYTPTFGMGQNGVNGSHVVHNSSYSKVASITFKPSPFYEIKEQLSAPTNLPGSRHSVSFYVSLTAEHIAQLRNNSSIRIMVYGATDSDQPQKDLAFPSAVELTCNGEQYQGNLKGVKKKPGTTKPADVTQFIHKEVYYKNHVCINYAQTDRRFNVMAYLVRKTTPEELLSKLRTGARIPKEKVIEEMNKKRIDADVVAGSTKLSLKCPISALRMQTPCRSTICSHYQCFDALSFLQLQEQAPQWQCPICNRQIAMNLLAVDGFFQGILESTKNSVDQVILEPDGTWKVFEETNDFRAPAGKANGLKRKSEVLDLDGTIEIVSMSARRVGSSPFSVTPVREDSATASVAESNRSAGAVIDLTLSDDDEPARPPVKKQSTGSFSGAPTNTSVPRPTWTTQAAAAAAASRPVPRPTATYQTPAPPPHRNIQSYFPGAPSTGNPMHPYTSTYRGWQR